MKHYQIDYCSMDYPLCVNMDTTYDEINYIIDQFLDKAKSDIEKFTQIGIVCRGSSGAIMATILYTKFKAITTDKSIKICHVKKSGENSHSSSVCAFTNNTETMYIWIDDFIDSGETFYQCLKEMRSCFGMKSFEFDWAVCATGGRNLNRFENNTKNVVMHLIS